MQCGDNHPEELLNDFDLLGTLKISHFDFYDKQVKLFLEVIARNWGWLLQQACLVILVIKIDIFQNDFRRGTRRLL